MVVGVLSGKHPTSGDATNSTLLPHTSYVKGIRGVGVRLRVVRRVCGELSVGGDLKAVSDLGYNLTTSSAWKPFDAGLCITERWRLLVSTRMQAPLGRLRQLLGCVSES